MRLPSGCWTNNYFFCGFTNCKAFPVLDHFDILRWKIGKEVLNGPIYTIDASAGVNAISTAGGKVNTYPKTVIENRVFTARNYI